MKRNIQSRVADIIYKEQIIDSDITCMNRSVFAELTQKIKELDKELRQYGKQDQRLLQTIPGLGPTTSAALIAEITNIARFPTHKQFTAFLGLDPRTHQSGVSINGKGYITKRGNAILRTLIYNCTSVAIQRPNMFQDYYQDKVSKGKPKMVSLVATMHKMTRVIYAVWRKQTPYSEPSS
ncbi:MAG: IS110 family transposase [Nanoarchaeota archaeon]